MLIVIEGLDRTGKSTLAQALAQEYSLEYRHADKPQAHPLDEYARPLEGAPPRRVLDRYHLGERVWPAVFGRESEYDDAMHLYVELVLLSRGAVLVRPSRQFKPGELERVIADEPVDFVQWHAAADLFAEEFKRTLLPTHAWSYCLDTLERRGKIVNAAGEASWAARRAASWTPRFVGAPDAHVVLVGEQVGPSSNGWTLPFVPYRGSSGHFLMSELVRLEPEVLRNVAIVNALQPDGAFEPLTEFISRVPRRGWRPPRVIALGNVAATRLRQLEIPHEKAPHPQYVRRFLRKNGPGWYAQQIMEAAA